MYMFVGAKHTKHNHKPQSVLFLYYVYVWGCNAQQTQPQTARHFYFYIMYTVWGCNAHQTIHNIHYTPFINRYSLRISGTFYPYALSEIIFIRPGTQPQIATQHTNHLTPSTPSPHPHNHGQTATSTKPSPTTSRIFGS